MMQTESTSGCRGPKKSACPSPAARRPNVTIVNIGHDVTCSVTVDGVEIKPAQRALA